MMAGTIDVKFSLALSGGPLDNDIVETLTELLTTTLENAPQVVEFEILEDTADFEVFD